jgi:hypothetical protein
MFKVSLDEELRSEVKRRKEEIDGSDAVKEVLLIEQGNAIEDNRIANGLGRKHTMVKAQAVIGEKLQLEKLEDKYAGDVYSLKQIKDLAIKYNLRFLKSKYFEGNIPVEVLAKIREYSNTIGIAIDNHSLQENYFILAPAKMFDISYETVEVEKIIRLPKSDPVMFYKLPYRDGYKLIHVWGSSFNIFRRWSGIRNANPYNYFVIKSCEDFCIYTLLFVLLAGSATTALMSWWWFALPLAVSLIRNFVRCFVYNDDVHEKEKLQNYTEHCWDKEKLIKRKVIWKII